MTIPAASPTTLRSTAQRITRCSLAQEHQTDLPFWCWFGFPLGAGSWKSSQVLGGVSQPKALGHMTQVERFDVEDVLEFLGIGGVGTKERLQC